MTRNGKKQTKLVSFQLSSGARRILADVAKDRTNRAGRRVPMVLVLEEAIRLLADREREENKA